jgi:tetratricopeptide (TPR) repeat protein
LTLSFDALHALAAAARPPAQRARDLAGWRPAARGALAGAALLGSLLIACGPRSQPRTALELSQEAQKQLAQNHAAEARAGFDAALDRDPRLLPAVRGRVEASRRLGRLPEVLAEAEARVAASPGDGVGHYQLGLARFARGDEPGAVAALRKAAELLPQQADAHYRLGVALFDGEKFADARAPLTRAVELDPQSARYRVPLATCLDRLGEHKAALAHLAQVPALSPTPDEAALAVQAARTITDPFRGLAPEAKQGLELALGYLLKDAPGLAVPVLDTLLEKVPDLGPAHALLGLAAQRMDEAGRAASELKRAAELSPESPQPHAWLGELYASKDKPELAIQEYRLALERNPLEVASLRKLGLLLLGTAGGAGSALGPLRAAASLEPADATLAVLVARTELQLPAEAARGRARLETLAEERPEDPEVLLRLAQALTDQRAQASEAERTALAKRASVLAEKVLQLQPGNALASRILSQTNQ